MLLCHNCANMERGSTFSPGLSMKAATGRCHHCVDKDKPPKIPIANNDDGSNGVDLYTSDGGVTFGVNIFLLVSSYLGHSGARFHLHPELVDESGDV